MADLGAASRQESESKAVPEFAFAGLAAEDCSGNLTMPVLNLSSPNSSHRKRRGSSSARAIESRKCTGLHFESYRATDSPSNSEVVGVDVEKRLEAKFDLSSSLVLMSTPPMKPKSGAI